MSIEGRIAIDIGFTDTYTAESVQSVQRLTLTGTNTYTSGKVAVITGTMTTAGTTLSSVTGFRDASGQTVTINAARRVAFQCSKQAILSVSTDTAKLLSDNGSVSVSDVELSQVDTITLSSRDPSGWLSGTAAYTVFLYGT